MISALGGNTAAFGMMTDGFIWDVASITNIPIPLFELFRLVDGDICLDYCGETHNSDRIDKVASMLFPPDGKSMVADVLNKQTGDLFYMNISKDGRQRLPY